MGIRPCKPLESWKQLSLGETSLLPHGCAVTNLLYNVRMKIDQLIRSDRKTIAILVRRDGTVIVRAPHRATNQQIMGFVEQKRAWIEEKLLQASQRTAQAAPRAFAAGERFRYLGGEYPLEIVRRARPALSFDGACFTLAESSLPRARETFEAWYRAEARRVISERAQVLAAHHRLAYSKIKITSARTRWGSCSSLGTLSFTWRLVMAPLPVIDYVIIHELAHLVERNHSKRFWDRVKAMLPDYAKHVRWLKENGFHLSLE